MQQQITAADITAIHIPTKLPGPNSKTIVLLHGYGANMHDLASLAQLFDPQGQHQWYFPNAILVLPEMGPYMGRAWFHLNIDRFVKQVNANDEEGLIYDLSPGVLNATDAVAAFIRELNLDAGQLVLGGFSQGAIISAATWLNHNLAVKTLLLWSGALVGPHTWSNKLDALSHKPNALVSHGTQDPVLPVSLGRNLSDFLKSVPLNVDYIEFAGGHEIAPNVLKRSYELINQ